MSKAFPLQEVAESKFWNPDEFWKDEEVFVIGGGPSLKGFDWGLLASHKVIGCNDAYRLGPVVDINIFADSSWFRYHRDDLRYSSGITVGIVSQPLKAHWVNWMLRRQRDPGKAKPYELPWYGNTGVAGISLAIRLGASKINLLGFDMKLGDDKEINWHEHNMSSANPKIYSRFMSHAEMYAKWLKENIPDVEILNCNPDSAMDVWAKVSLEDVL